MTAPAKLDGMTATWVETTGIADHLAVTTIAEVAADTVVVAETAVAVAIVVDAVAMVAEAETAAVEAEIADGDARHAETRPSCTSHRGCLHISGEPHCYCCVIQTQLNRRFPDVA